MLAMIFLGIGEIVGGLFNGQVIDKLGNRASTYVNLVLIVIQTLVTVTFIHVGVFSELAFVMTFIWGLQDSASNIQAQEILGFEFESNSTPFSVFNLVQSGAVLLIAIIEAFL